MNDHRAPLSLSSSVADVAAIRFIVRFLVGLEACLFLLKPNTENRVMKQSRMKKPLCITMVTRHFEMTEADELDRAEDFTTVPIGQRRSVVFPAS